MNSPTHELEVPLGKPPTSFPRTNSFAKVLWSIGIAAPFPFVLYPIFSDLFRIPLTPTSVFLLLLWVAAIFLFVFMIYRRWDKVTHFPANRIAYALIAVGTPCFLISVVFWSNELVICGWILLVMAWLSVHLPIRSDGKASLLSHGLALCALLQLHPTLETLFCNAYQHLLAASTLYGLDSCGIPIRRGNLAFELARSTFSVDEVLVHFPSLAWLMFVCLGIFSWLRRPLLLLPAYLGIAAFWAFGMHLAQLLIVGYARHYDIDLSMGWHSILLSTATVSAAVGLTLSSDRCLRVFFMPVPIEYVTSGSFNPMHRLWNRSLLSLAVDETKSTSQYCTATKS